MNIENIGNKRIIIVDIDGTVSRVGDRLKYILQEKKDWTSFYDSCFEDKPIQDVITMLHCLQHHFEFVFCTGRRESVREKTEQWLENYKLFGRVLMRKNGDTRHDTITKPELLEENGISLSQIHFVLEDRNSMVKKWRELGLTCLQVADGDF